MKKPRKSKTQNPASPELFPVDDDEPFDPEARRRQVAKEACEELDLPDFTDHGYDE